MVLDSRKLYNIVYQWVENNFGTSEAEYPSWDIGALATYIAKQYDKPLEEKAEPYELALLVRADMSLKELDTLHDIIMSHFEDGDGWECWKNTRVKRLAYKIRGEEFGGRFQFEGSLKRSERVELSRFLDGDYNVLGYLLIKQNGKKRSN